MQMPFILTLALGVACAPKVAELPTHRTTHPDPLAPRAFQLPEAQTGYLSNGIPVTVVENHEVPMVNVRIAFDQGGWTDTPEQPGLAAMTLDMMNEGAGDYDAAGLSKASRELATNLGTGAGDDSSRVYIGTLNKNLEPSLDLLTIVLREPTFPQADWDLLKKKKLADLETARNNPRSIASRVYGHLLYGESYKGSMRTESGYAAITPEAMRTWWSTHLTPGNARIYVGGDTNLAIVLPLLEARLGAWKAEGVTNSKPRDGEANVEETTIFLVDKPGAPQSVLKVFQRVDANRTDDVYFDFYMANMVFGGMFSARINMNLREDKGWTYGARSSVQSSFAPLVWSCSTSVKTDTTQGSISEIIREVTESKSTRPFDSDELEGVGGYLLGSRPVRFEQPSYLLGQIQDIWLYELPDDWVSAYADRVRAVGIVAAQAAWNRLIDPTRLSILVVGDAATIRAGLEDLGYPIVLLNADGIAVEETE